MALTTVQTEMVNNASPINDEYSIGDRVRFLSTDGIYGSTSDTGAYVVMQVTTAPTETTTGSGSTDFAGPHGLIYCTASGYYTLAAPVNGCQLDWFHQGCTDQFIRARQAGTGGTAPSFYVGTGTTYMVIETTKQAGSALRFVGLSTDAWLVLTHTSDDALCGLATSS